VARTGIFFCRGGLGEGIVDLSLRPFADYIWPSHSRPSTLHGEVVQVIVTDLDAFQRRDLAKILLDEEVLHAT
jgi:hypothetical protein